MPVEIPELKTIDTLGSLHAMVYSNYVLSQSIHKLLVDIKAKLEGREKDEVMKEVVSYMDIIRALAREEFVGDFRVEK